MLFSFIIPTIDDDRIAKAITSIKNSIGWSSNDCEIVVVVNGCADEYLFKLKYLFSQDNNVRFFYFKDRNIAKARNLGIKNSSGLFIIHIDSDCLMHYEYIKNLRGIISAQDISILRGSIDFIPRKNIFSKLNCEIRDFFYNGCPTKCFTPNLVVRKTLYEDVGFFNKEIFYGEDTEQGCRINPKSTKIYHFQNLIIYHLDNAKIIKTVLTWFRYGVGKAFKVKQNNGFTAMNRNMYYKFESCMPTTAGRNMIFKLFLLIYKFVHEVGFLAGVYFYRRRKKR